jgi:hypothetical protein
VQVSFFKSYKGLRFDGEDGRQFAYNQGLDEIVRVPFTLEHPDIDVPFNVQVCLEKCLKLTTGLGPASPHEEFDKLVHLGTLYKAFFSGVTRLPEGASGGNRRGGRNEGLSDFQGALQRCFEVPLANLKNTHQESRQSQPE